MPQQQKILKAFINPVDYESSLKKPYNQIKN